MSDLRDLFRFPCGPPNGLRINVILHRDCLATWNYYASANLTAYDTSPKLVLAHELAAECEACGKSSDITPSRHGNAL